MGIEEAKLIQQAILQLADPPAVKALAIVADLAIVATALFILFQLRHSVLAHEIRKVRAHDRIAQWNEPIFADRRKGIYRRLRQLPPDAVATTIETDDDFRSVVVQILNFFEALGLGVKDKVIDENVAREFFIHIVTSYHTAATDVIEHHRQRRGERRPYKEFTWLASKWATRLARHS